MRYLAIRLPITGRPRSCGPRFVHISDAGLARWRRAAGALVIRLPRMQS